MSEKRAVACFTSSSRAVYSVCVCVCSDMSTVWTILLRGLFNSAHELFHYPLLYLSVLIARAISSPIWCI